jgi:hypothetical protein
MRTPVYARIAGNRKVEILIYLYGAEFQFGLIQERSD